MCALEGRNIRRSMLLIVGATGDVGSGCARCLAPMVRRVLLSASNLDRLRKLAAELESGGVQVEIATNLQPFSAEADIVICAVSLASPSLLLGGRIAPRRTRLRCGLPEEPISQRGDAWRQNLLRRSRTGHWGTEILAGFSWSPESASVPRCGPRMSTRRHGSCSRWFRALLSRKSSLRSGSRRLRPWLRGLLRLGWEAPASEFFHVIDGWAQRASTRMDAIFQSSPSFFITNKSGVVCHVA